MSKPVITAEEARNRASVSPAELASLTGLSEINVLQKSKSRHHSKYEVGSTSTDPRFFLSSVIVWG